MALTQATKVSSGMATYRRRELTEVLDSLIHLARGEMVYDVLVTYGQSNSAGEAILSGDTSGFPQPYDTSLMYDFTDGTIKKIRQNIVSSSGVASSGHAWGEFANEWYRLSGRGIVVVHCGRGAQSIEALSKGASSGSSDYYGLLVSGVAAAKARMAIEGLPIGSTFVGFHQGETNQSNLTTFDSYRGSLVKLIADLASDIGFTRFCNFTVGCPANRPEYAWATIQNAQRFVCCGRDKAITVFDGCPSFLLRDGNVGAEGVHYTQKGYNTMGREGARGLWSMIGAGESNKTDVDLNQYNQWVAPWSRAKHCFAAARFASSTNAWALLHKSNDAGIWRPANINDVKVADDGNSLEFYVADSARMYFSLDASVNRVLFQYGIRATAENIQSGNDFKVKVVLYADLEVLVNTVTGDMRAFKQAGSLPGWVGQTIQAQVNAPGEVTLTHGSTVCYPQVSYYASSNGQYKAADVSLHCVSATTTKVYSSVTVNDQNPWVAVSFRRMLIAPNNLAGLDGTIYLKGTYAPEF